MATTSYQPHIDGLRAIAVLAVMLSLAASLVPFLSSHPNVTLFSLDNFFCNTTHCSMGTPSESLYSDTNHLSAAGAKKAALALTTMLQE